MFEIVKLVEVTLVPLAFVNKKLVAVADAKNAFVEVRFVKTPVLAVVAPIAELFTVPPLIVRPSTTIASVIELVGKVRVPVTPKLVEVSEVPEALVNEKFVEVAALKKALVEVKFVPVALVKSKFVVVAAEKNAFVEVRFVKTPVLGVVAPMVELLIVPPLIVKAPVTIASVIESAGKDSEPLK
jgi:hypothetical protein